MSSFNAAIIGLGHQAHEDHIPGLRESKLAELVAVCDSDEVALEKTARELSVPAYRDYRQLLDREDVDLIIVCTPHDTHEAIVRLAADNSIHVLKEKPFARSLKEARELKRVSDRTGITVMTTLQRRFNPIYTTYFQLAEHIGNPFFIDVRYTLFVDEPHSGWRGQRKIAGGGCLIDMGYHMIDLIIWYFGLPSSVVAFTSCTAIEDGVYDAEDTACFMFQFDSGIQGVCRLSRFYPPKSESFRVIGTTGIVEIERGKIRRLRSDGSIAESLSRDHAWTAAAATQIDYFCRVVRGERENVGPPEHHLQHAALIDACYQSAETGHSINPQDLLAKAGAHV